MFTHEFRFGYKFDKNENIHCKLIFFKRLKVLPAMNQEKTIIAKLKISHSVHA